MSFLFGGRVLGEKSPMSGQPFQNFLRLIGEDMWINAFSNVPYNPGICTILRFSESGNCANLEIAQMYCAVSR